MASAGQVNLAVVGRSAVGKTTLIHRLLSHKDDTRYPSTKDWSPNVYQGNDKIVLWDSPGFNELKDLNDELSGDIYDGIVLVVKDRLSSDEKDALAKIMQANPKRLIVVRLVSESEPQDDIDAAYATLYEDYQSFRKDIFFVDLNDLDLYGYADLVRHLDNGATFRRAHPRSRLRPSGRQRGEDNGTTPR